ncbi:MAG: efflux RND transporter periplasmic adaptor subunit [Rhizobiaceae bacterium]|nr:efflux RND transporter periplasmic adaptor subunit [Rhizobiaceae bacterium]
MSVWKQLAAAVVVLFVAAAAWVKFFPGAGDTLATWGIDWIPVATAKTENGTSGGQGERRGGGGPRGSVVTAPVQMATINDRLAAIGTGRAISSVVVTPYAAGRLTEIAATAGSTVSAGSVIARLDSEAEEIAVDRARIALEDAQARLERVTTLQSSRAASQVQLKEAEVAVGNASLQLRDAELALERRSIVAPISGIVGILQVSVGNGVTASTEIATIDDRSRVIVDFWVPERYAGAIQVGAPMTAIPIARPNEAFEGTVSAVDNRLDEASRTLRVQARIENPGDSLRAGMSFQVSMRFPGDSYPAVNPLAIQWGTDGAFVWIIRDGKAVRTPVRIVQRNTESVLVEAALASGDTVITEGVHNVREGAEIRIAGADTGGGGS